MESTVSSWTFQVETCCCIVETLPTEGPTRRSVTLMTGSERCHINTKWLLQATTTSVWMPSSTTCIGTRRSPTSSTTILVSREHCLTIARTWKTALL
uniref:Uncharacterized protein n=1 Tax=Hyaloperonospora arabidopsidis (strain Emoy2) TaxID=559515 RepID=M4BFI7_HYAAE